ncbi:ABC transporter permease [Profundibacter sp.]|uniref:ABC transporter permease n=1 Tax=Profundibacter sp. TaxID=3101071 RepID=UPI003D0C500A
MHPEITPSSNFHQTRDTTFAGKAQMSQVYSELWDFIGDDTILGASVPVWTALIIAVIAHIALTRSRIGWHILAVGGSRRSAHNAGIRVRRMVFLTYVFSGFTAGLAGFLFATRLRVKTQSTC